MDPLYSKALGARLLSVANDLKRTPEALARELHLPEPRVRQILTGEADTEAALDLLHRMVAFYPLPLAEVWVERPDTDQGVRLMKAADSVASSRVFSRRGRGGALSPYYEYRDTATSRLAPYRPEWIQPLRIVADADADNPDVVYNHGHLMHQTTFFIGKVNFYWSLGGRRYCAELETGDSNYITPFVPHSFTSRDAAAPGVIIAVTYGAEVGRALDALARVGAEGAGELAGDLREPGSAHAALVRRYRSAESLSPAQLTQRLQEAGVVPQRAEALASGAPPAHGGELEALATALGVRPSDLAMRPLAPEDEVIVRRARDGRARPYPDTGTPSYRVMELARTPHQPGLRGFDWAVLDASSQPALVRHGLHEYIYNHGDAPVVLRWGRGQEALLGPGDSAYVEPMAPHGFSRVEGEGRLVVIRVPGALSDPVLRELSTFATEGRQRTAGESRSWF
jgi:methylphosphonate synthase